MLQDFPPYCTIQAAMSQNQIAGRLVTSFGENDNSSSSDPILKEVVGSDKLVAQLDDPINRETGYSNVLGSDSL